MNRLRMGRMQRVPQSWPEWSALPWRYPESEAPAKPCWHCRHFLGIDVAGGCARCGADGRLHSRAQPAQGCVFFEREPGVDDDPLQPPPGLRRPLPPIGIYGSWVWPGSPWDGPPDPRKRPPSMLLVQR